MLDQPYAKRLGDPKSSAVNKLKRYTKVQSNEGRKSAQLALYYRLCSCLKTLFGQRGEEEFIFLVAQDIERKRDTRFGGL